jgi:hypothetical protein
MVYVFIIALVLAGIGEVEQSIDWLEKAVEERSYWLIYIDSDPALDLLRDRERFESLRKRVRNRAEGFNQLRHEGTKRIKERLCSFVVNRSCGDLALRGRNVYICDLSSVLTFPLVRVVLTNR